MLDWKILAASFAALLFVSSLLVGDFAIKDFFSTVVEKIGDWLGNSPFGGMVTAPTSSVIEANRIQLKIYPESFVLKPEHPLNVSFKDGKITEFLGDITVDYGEKKITLDESNSALVIEMDLEDTRLDGLAIKRLVIHNTKIDVSTGEWELTSQNGSIEIYDFSGFGEIDSNLINFDGNVSRLVRL